MLATTQLSDGLPTISVQPRNQVARIGASTSFSVDAGGGSDLSFQWLKNGIAVAGATSSVLNLHDVKPNDAATYTVVVRNSRGSITSEAATLTVLSPLVITKEPTNQVAKAGADASFVVQAKSALVLSYFWFKDKSFIPGATSNVLTLRSVQEWDAGRYAALVYTSEGSLWSQAATLTISGAVAPQIVVHPTNLTRLVGSGAIFSVQARGGLPFGFQWFKNGFVFPDETSSNLTIAAVHESDAGSYHAVVTNRGGSVSSARASLIVNVPPSITAQPTNRVVFAGATVTFNVAARGTPAPTYTWFKNGARVQSSLNPALVLSSVRSVDGGTYFAVVSNVVGMATSVVANLTVQVPAKIKTQPTNQTVFLGQTATFKVDAEGDVPVSFQWSKGTNTISAAINAVFTITNAQLADIGNYRVAVSNLFAKAVSPDVVLSVRAVLLQPTNQVVLMGSNATFKVVITGPSDLRYQWVKEGKPIGGATGSELRLLRVQPADAGNYSVWVSAQFGSMVTPMATLTVNTPVFIRLQPQNRLAAAGSNVRFGSDVGGTLPIRIQWLSSGSPIPNATNAALELVNVRLIDQGDYRFIASNAFGSVTSSVARLTVVNASPLIRVQPESRTNRIGSDTSFTVEADGTAPLSYQWFKDGRLMLDATNQLLVLRALQPSDDGDYRVVVRNAFGMAESSAARLVVGQPPVISLQPFGQTARVGGRASFWLLAAGTAPLDYQWFKDGLAIPAATNSMLTHDAVKSLDAGTYSVVASNMFGQAKSEEAVLLVRAPLAVKGDLNRDGQADLIFQDDRGLMAAWYLSGTEMISADFFVPMQIDEPGWNIVGSGVFDSDGNADLVLQHRDGRLAVWSMDGRTLKTGAFLNVGLQGSEDWRVVEAGDFDLDDQTDLLVRASNGRLAVWYVDRFTVIATAVLNLGNPVEAHWAVAGVGDFNEDGKLDVLFQHEDGTLAVWFLDGTRTLSIGFLEPRNPGNARWRVVGTTDRNRDGMPDLLFQNEGDGGLVVWLMSGLRLVEARFVNPFRPGGTWRVVAP
ncbi:MAG: immunoglobulin domain-containing protein [Verrucomicrobia bacterium]|nr:immunoglobulin domain-containing protein [Verrucomicrobiota bacterium]